jgi:hypothetical protein
MKTNKWIVGIGASEGRLEKLRRSAMSIAAYDFAFSVRSLRSLAAKSVWIMERRSRGFSLSPDYRDSATSSHRQLPATKGTDLHPTPPITNPSTVKPFLSGASTH